ncbi:MAG: DNA helicase RecQ [Methylococcaceae bacterium]
MKQAQAILKSVFGYDSFRGQQYPVIEQVLTGGDALVLMPTGGGKSLCYQIPALLRSGVGVVISPLIALMQDQVSALLQLGIRAAFLNSSLSISAAQAIEQQLLNAELDLLYIAPERLTNPRTLDLFKKLDIALFAIDEAHCVSQWGHDFRADYLQLCLLHEQFPTIPRIALTATADETTRQEIITRLQLENAPLFISGFDRPNIRYQIVQKQNARHQLLDFIKAEHKGDCGIVYCLSRKKVDDTALWLQAQGIPALPYHAGMDNAKRKEHQQRFLRDDYCVMVATIAFGMGIDKPNVRFVAHLDLPKSVEAYYQETGRAGRDGLPANAWLAYGLQDVITLSRMIASSEADEVHKRLEQHKLNAMLALCEQVQCRRQALLSYFGDHLEHNCNNCDTCLRPVDSYDGTLVARQALSCIFRTGQRFGVHYLIDVLLGKETERVKQFNHHKQSTFGIGKAVNEEQWHSIFRQLVAKGLVNVNFDQFGALQLTENCRPILRGEQQLLLRKDVKLKREKITADKTQKTANQNQILWEALRTKRSEIAKSQNVPAYVIFHDATLMAMMENKPKTLPELAELSGVGQRKLELYGAQFLEVLNSFNNTAGFSDTVSFSITLFQQGLTIEQIAGQRELKTDTIYTHLSEALEQGIIPLNKVIDLDPAEIKQIEEAFLALPQEQWLSLKLFYEQFAQMYSYGVLRCIRSALIYKTA